MKSDEQQQAEDYEAQAYAEEMKREYEAMLKDLQYHMNHMMRNACARCGNPREDWHNKLCGDEFCAKCSMFMDQIGQPTTGDLSYGQEIQTHSQVSTPSQRGHAPASQRKASR